MDDREQFAADRAARLNELAQGPGPLPEAKAFFDASLRPGFDIVAEAVNLPERIAQADLCITGEGRLDSSSLSGKAPVALARLCRMMNVPCAAVVGSLQDGLDFSAEFASARAISDGRDTAQAVAQARELLARAACDLIQRLLRPRPSPRPRPSGSG